MSYEGSKTKAFDTLVKSFFTAVPADVDDVPDTDASDIPPRSPSRMGFRDTLPLRQRPMSKRVPVPVIEEVDIVDADDIDSDSSDEWSADSDTGDSNVIFYTPSTSYSNPSPRETTYSPIAADCPLVTPQPTATPPRPPSATIPHHGLSRSALQHQKWMWNARYDEWMQWQMEVDGAASAYGGIADTPSGRAASPPPPARRSATPEPEPRAPQTNENIFPRTGDLSALRDPHAATLDRAFCNYPLCTIQKVLLVFNMNQPACKETDNLPCHAEPADANADADTTDVGEVTGSNHFTAPNITDESNAPSTTDATPAKALPTSQSSSWQVRWQVLTDLVKTTDISAPTVTTSIGLPVVARSLETVTNESSACASFAHFFFAEEGDSEDSEVQCVSDEEEDYGEVLVNSRFAPRLERGVEVEVAREFLENEMQRVDCRSGARTLRF
ncbi:hypothetical protein FA95DRAFT_1598879 [Auriscalpium vulgare]|uniref:Uncharacterized protein n=1 Tax=Auriscalpium vulgare TaxID=40419 RepID=A0ACB8RC01_9AGAM|nr:hypothetical protein FA95DRAFT_1598879 [Auriscalpium vulgare]